MTMPAGVNLADQVSKEQNGIRRELDESNSYVAGVASQCDVVLAHMN